MFLFKCALLTRQRKHHKKENGRYSTMDSRPFLRHKPPCRILLFFWMILSFPLISLPLLSIDSGKVTYSLLLDLSLDLNSSPPSGNQILSKMKMIILHENLETSSLNCIDDGTWSNFILVHKWWFQQFPTLHQNIRTKKTHNLNAVKVKTYVHCLLCHKTNS